jgi:putative ABC transport system permease protein
MRGGKVRGALVVAEVALALTLLVSAGLLFRSVRQILSIEPGFDPAGVVTLQVVQAGRAFDSDAARLGFYDQALAAVRAVPGVESAAFTSLLPLSGEVDGYGYEVEPLTDRQRLTDNALRYAVSPEYFATMRIPLVQGRLLAATDRPGAPPAVVINQRMARRLFGDADPLGRRLRFGPQMGNGRWMEVVGVVGDVRHYSLAVDPPDLFYVANGQWEWTDNVETLAVRAAPDRAVALIPSLQRAVWQVNPNVPIARIRPMADFVRASAGTRRFTLLALQTLALTALLLSALGLYGVVSGSVTERVREIGIRTALGASPGDVVGQVARHAVSLTLAGAAIGLLGAYGGSRLIGSMLFGVSPLDPLTYGAVVALLGAVALLAAWAPARRAAAVDPTAALRAE